MSNFFVANLRNSGLLRAIRASSWNIFGPQSFSLRMNQRFRNAEWVLSTLQTNSGN